ncbi:2-polyprenyl-6-methoxyphenol hydroxylase-like oxidoreductase [Mycobacterium sp. NS-7484]|uniref:FAD-dependent oxidoreductase n=1 Tax=Mycobacterium sp. NS-7484 TaxID=1834161 RepID=UPI00096F05E8|nr:FAD-dependent monooxygenase [Mycobacterium sp. NS-7484]OMB96400.1 2-polyprenyl-6-methoxyphenol hydroxylase-like oxidoreductase [Mycobacterium sp. NS-7484]
MTRSGGHAVVLGASMAGALAARVLAEHYETVTIVERDEIPDTAQNRRGVPQGRHAHALLARSSAILDELFPGFLDELVAGGVGKWDDGDLSKLWISVGGHLFLRSGTAPSAPTQYYPSRAFLEWSVRRRLAAIDNISVLSGHDVRGLTASPGGARVTGVVVQDRNNSSPTELAADLVVDATGRGSRTPTFLAELGYSRPREDELVVRLAYVSQMLTMSPDALPEHLVAIFPEPGRPTTWALIGYENNIWMLTQGTMAGLEPPANFTEMQSFGEGFAPPQALEAVRAADPLGEVAHYRVPSNRWRRYDKMRRFPDGLLVIGDAICSFNPIYGQGMTLAAIEATILRECLQHTDNNLARRFFTAAARPLRVAWQTAVGSDLALPEVIGPRPWSMRLSNAYLGRVMSAAEHDPAVTTALTRVTGMIDAPTRLFRPAIAYRAARAGRVRDGRRTDYAVASTSPGSSAAQAN